MPQYYCFKESCFWEGAKKIKKEEWFKIIPELADPDSHTDSVEPDLQGMIIHKMEQVRKHTVGLYKLLSGLSIERLQTCLGPVVLDYFHDGPRRLKIVLPIPLPTIKVLSYCLDARSRGAVMQYSTIRNYWHSLVADVMDWGYKNGTLRDFYAFQKAIVDVKFFEIDLRTRDADNYCLVILHNSLVHNGVIVDDNFERMKYCVSGVGGYKREQTVVTVIEDL